MLRTRAVSRNSNNLVDQWSDDAQEVDALMFGAEPSEDWGLSLVRTMIDRFQLSAPPFNTTDAAPEGPHFQYSHTPSLFSGRLGSGPLRVAWDTNLLIDYFKFGSRLWEGRNLPGGVAEEYGKELEALQVLIAAWVGRDIDFQILEPTLTDSKRKPLSGERVAARSNALQEFASAVAHGRSGFEEVAEPVGPVDWNTKRRILKGIPGGNDRVLVERALDVGAHVYLTRDKKVLAPRLNFRPFGLLLASPQDMVEELGAAGVLHAFWNPSYFYWPMPDQARVAHLVKALGMTERPDEGFLHPGWR